MPSTKSNNSKQTTLNYQSLYLWTRFLLGIISLGIIICNRRSVLPAKFRIQEFSVIPNKVRDLQKVAWIEFPCHTRDDNFVSTHQINSLLFASSLALSALTYQLSGNSVSGLSAVALNLIFRSANALPIYKRQSIREFSVANDSRNNLISPAVTVLKDSSFIVSWSGPQNAVYFRRFDRNGAPMTGDIIAKMATGTDPLSSAAALSDGAFAISWRSLNQSWNLSTQVYKSNNSLVSEFNIYTDPYSLDGGLIANNPLKTFMMLWHHYFPNASDLDVYAKVYHENGTAVTEAFPVNNFTLGNQSRWSAKVLSNSCYLITWTSADQDGSSFGVYARSFDHRNVLGPEFIVNQFTKNAQMSSTVISFLNEFLILWKSQGQEQFNFSDPNSWQHNHGVYGRRFDNNGTALGNEFQVNFHTSSNWYGLSATALGDNHFVAVWPAYKVRTNSTYNTFDIYGQVCNRFGVRVGPEFFVNNPNSIIASRLAIDALDNDTFVVVWDSLENSQFFIKARIFNLAELGIDLPVTTTASSTTTKEVTDSVEFSLSKNSPAFNKDSNFAAYIGGAALGGFSFAVCLGAIGFYAWRKKLGVNKSVNAESNKNDVALLDNRSVAEQNKYTQVDQTKQPAQQYDHPIKLGI